MRLFRLIPVFTAVVIGLAPVTRAHAEDVELALKSIYDRVIAKAQAGQGTEADLAVELNDLSDLQQKYRTNRGVASQLLLVRAQIYEKVIQDREMALILYQQVATDYPGTPAGNEAAVTVEAARATADDQPPGPRSRASSSTSAGSSSSATSSSRRSGGSAARRSTSSSARSSSGEEPSRPAGSLAVGSTFPDFSVQDIDGTPLSLSQFAGDIILVDFWAAYNDASVATMDQKMSIYRRYHGKGFEIIGINRNRDRAPMINFLNERGITWPQYYDEDGKLARRYNVSDVPASYLLDRQGKILAVNVDVATLVRLLDRQINYGY